MKAAFTILTALAFFALPATQVSAEEEGDENRVYIFSPTAYVDNCGCPESYSVHCTSPDDTEKELKATTSNEALDEFDRTSS